MTDRKNGSVLIFSLVIVLLFFGMALAFVNLGSENERDVRAQVFTNKALYLAESGINASIYELIQNNDPGGDGVGNLSRTVSGGSYQVTVTPRADKSYDAVSRGTDNGYSSVVEVTLVPTFRPIDPAGAIGLSGVIPDPGIANFTEQMSRGQVRIDGGNAPAITVQDDNAWADLLRETTTLMNSNSRYITPGMFTGQPTVPIRLGDGFVEMPLQQVENPTIDSELLEALRVELFRNVMTNKVPAANRVVTPEWGGLDRDVVWGTPENPQITVMRGNLLLNMDRNIVGSGDLVIIGRLSMEHRSSLRWDGNVYVLGTGPGSDSFGRNNAWLRNDGARIDINGNLLLIETDSSSAELGHVPHEAEHRDIEDIHTIVNGTLFVAHGPFGEHARIATPCGTLIVNGLLAMNGERISFEHQPGSNLIVNGSIQAGLCDGRRLASTFRLKLSGPAQITYNRDLVYDALEKLSSIIDINIDDRIRKKLLGYNQRGWRTTASY